MIFGFALHRDSGIEAGAAFICGAAMARGGWVYVGERAGNKPSAGEKSVITAACEKLITEVLTPRFLPKIRPTQFNYPIAIYGSTATNTASLRAIDPTTPARTRRNSRPPLRASDSSTGIVSTCPITAIRANGSAFLSTSRWWKP